MTSAPMNVRDEDPLGSARTVSAGGGIRSVGKPERFTGRFSCGLCGDTSLGLLTHISWDFPRTLRHCLAERSFDIWRRDCE